VRRESALMRYDMIHSNRELMQHFTEAFLKGDVATVQDYYAEDIIWYFPGRSGLAGVVEKTIASSKSFSACKIYDLASG
jgi:ketosteroid isomerase-like protein